MHTHTHLLPFLLFSSWAASCNVLPKQGQGQQVEEGSLEISSSLTLGFLSSSTNSGLIKKYRNRCEIIKRPLCLFNIKGEGLVRVDGFVSRNSQRSDWYGGFFPFVGSFFLLVLAEVGICDEEKKIAQVNIRLFVTLNCLAVWHLSPEPPTKL